MKHGIVLLDKPKGISSAAAVHRIKQHFHASKAGHGGTLDPMATGLLPIAIGEGTKLLSFCLDGDKEYVAEATLGVQTDTDDAEGNILARHDYQHVTEAQIREFLATQQGTIRQKPPVYSAIKQDGRALYKKARLGEHIETTAREVRVDTIELLSIELPRVRFRVRCGKGTYIRAIARDLGEALGVGAHLSALCRTHVGSFSLKDACTLETLGNVIPCEAAISFLPSTMLDEAKTLDARNGKVFSKSFWGFADDISGTVAVKDSTGTLIGLAEIDAEDRLCWLRIFHC